MYIWYLIEFKRQTYLIDLEHDIALRIYLRKYLPKINIPPEIPSSSRDLILDSFKSGGNSNGKQESLEKEKLSSNNRGGGGRDNKSGSKRFFRRDFHSRWKAFPVKTSANLIILAPYFDSKAPPPAAPDSFNYYTYSCSRVPGEFSRVPWLPATRCDC